MTPYRSFFWKKNPFLKLLLPLAAGILLQQYLQLPLTYWLAAFVLAILLGFVPFLLPLFTRFRFPFLSGAGLSLIMLAMGGLLTWQKDTRNHQHWFGHHYHPDDRVVVTLEEPPSEKNKSFKATASIHYLLSGDSVLPVSGSLIIYFSKEGYKPLRYGTRLLLSKPLQEIKNAGNPGGFDYKRYCLFQGITHQVFTRSGDYEVLPGSSETAFRKFIYASRENILQILRKNIPGEKESGLAEALLIGYKDDLEQSLVQSYTNTGVVHIIAISGLHLGLIYWLLALLLKPLQQHRRWRWVRAVLIIAFLWLFSLLAGAQPSILRSAVMFSCIIAGESLYRRSSIINTLAFSAFLLLCINPFWLWDVGFQLSYAAVLSIVLFMKPVYGLLYFPNKLMDAIWKLNAVTLSAQLLTLPLSIYHFHQFPLLFLVTNLLAVPLSGIILTGEILLCILSIIPIIAKQVGHWLSLLIRLMNTCIERTEALPFALWDGLYISLFQTGVLFLVISFISYWLLERSIPALKAGLFSLVCFAVLRSASFLESSRQQKIIVYNVPQKRAIDFVSGRHFVFMGDQDLLANDFARNFHLKPSRVMYRMDETGQLDQLQANGNYISFSQRHILLLDSTVSFMPSGERPELDLLILSGNPRLYLGPFSQAAHIKQVVIDGSVPGWKSRFWKKDCDSLHIPCHDVSTQGAFVMNLR